MRNKSSRFLRHICWICDLKKKKVRKKKAKQSTTAQWKWLSIHQGCTRNMSCYYRLEPCPTFWLLWSLCSTSFSGNRSHDCSKYKNKFLLESVPLDSNTTVRLHPQSGIKNDLVWNVWGRCGNCNYHLILITTYMQQCKNVTNHAQYRTDKYSIWLLWHCLKYIPTMSDQGESFPNTL